MMQPQRMTSSDTRSHFVHEVTAEINTWVDALAKIDILRPLSRVQRLLVGLQGKETTLPAKHVLGVPGGCFNKLFLIVEGDVVLTVPTTSGYRVVHHVRAGDAFPLSLLFGEEKVWTRACTTETTRVLMLDPEQLLILCGERPDIGSALFASAGRVMSKKHTTMLRTLSKMPERGAELSELWALA